MSVNEDLLRFRDVKGVSRRYVEEVVGSTINRVVFDGTNS